MLFRSAKVAPLFTKKSVPATVA
eukprot:COSAG06_NODE_59092_length_275_cov_0.613636_1_plen_22_part_10